MKTYYTVMFLFAISLVHAQTKQGTIVYERKIDVHRRMEDEQMKAMVPQFRTDKHELLFNENISVYKTLEEEDAPDPFDNGGGNRIMIRLDGPGDAGVLYKNFSSRELFQQTSLGDKEYIIDDTIHSQQWKLTNETKTILNHTCKKATTKTERGSDIVAWYAEDISTPAGPENFGGLPGVIVMLDANNGEIGFTAAEIKGTVSSKDLKEPSNGKHITRADFEKKVDEAFGPADSKGRRIITRD
jgi:GLPGLI family protein